MNVLTAPAIGPGLAADRRVVMKILALGRETREEIVVDEVRGVGRAHHDMNLAARRISLQQFHGHAAKRRDARARSKENIVVIVARDGQEESLTVRSRDLYLVPGPQVAHVVAAHAQEQAVIVGIVALLLGCALVDDTLRRRRDDFGVETDFNQRNPP